MNPSARLQDLLPASDFVVGPSVLGVAKEAFDILSTRRLVSPSLGPFSVHLIILVRIIESLFKPDTLVGVGNISRILHPPSLRLFSQDILDRTYHPRRSLWDYPELQLGSMALLASDLPLFREQWGGRVSCLLLWKWTKYP